MKKRLFFTLLCVLAIPLLLAASLLLFLTITEYKPAPEQPADRLISSTQSTPVGQEFTIFTWNIGYAGLGKDSDFFMDGGKMVDPPSQELVETNLAAIQSFLQENPADAWFLQEVDINSSRTQGMDQFSLLQESLSSGAAFAYNFKCPFVPIPIPPMGRMESGLSTLSSHSFSGEPQRISLPCPFTWPTRAANIKRCLLVTRMDVENSDKELVLVNLHLEAYESGEGRIAQTNQLLALMQEEYNKGNYVIAGGDFNQSFPGSLDLYPIQDPELWTPGALDSSDLPQGWQFAYDSSYATCRLLNQPYQEDCQLYAIDGFILSPNVYLEQVQTIPLNFEHSDHNPVRLQVQLTP